MSQFVPRKISVVVPCYNEEEIIARSSAAIVSSLDALAEARGCEYELIFVNDGSRDGSLGILQKLYDEHVASSEKHHGKMVVLSLSRNFGHQAALCSGLRIAAGEAVISMDADLQDPPELIGAMLDKWLAGADVVYCVRSSREGENLFKLLTAKVFYAFLRSLTGVEIPVDTGDFRLMDRRVVDVFKAMPEIKPFVRGMIPWIGFKQEPLYYERKKRIGGVTKYPLLKMCRLAIDGITGFSVVPLKVAYFFGFFVAALSLCLAGYLIYEYVFGRASVVTGWTSLMVVVLFLGSVQLITLGIIGDYLGRIGEQVKGRPLSVTDNNASRGL